MGRHMNTVEQAKPLRTGVLAPPSRPSASLSNRHTESVSVTNALTRAPISLDCLASL